MTCVGATKDSIQSALTQMQQAGVVYATEQIIDLIANGVNNIHIYSMNNAGVVQGILTNLSEIVG